jgi:hypothetical protein
MGSSKDHVTSDNPFEVSRVLGDNSPSANPYASPYDFDLEGNLIVCGSHLILPPICVHTGETQDLVEIQRHTVFPSMRLVVNQRSCYVITYMTRSEQSRRERTAFIYRVITTIGSLLMVAALLLRQKQTAVLFPAGLVICGLSLLLLHRHNLPLQLVRYNAPGIYRVRGFSKAFLAHLAIYKLNDYGRSSAVEEN